MAFRYGGLEPVPDGKGGIVRPGDERDQPDPAFGPWIELAADEDEPSAEPAPAPPAAPAAPKPAPATPAPPSPAEGK